MVDASNGKSTGALSERLSFLGLDEEASAALRDMGPLIREHLPDVLTGFYDLVRQYPALRAFFKDESHMEGARQLQINHWGSIVDGTFGDAYEASILKIGKTHSRIGLEPRWYIGGYAFIASGLVAAVIHAKLGSGFVTKAKKDDLAKFLSVLLRAVFLDMDMAISTYLSSNKIAFEAMLNNLTDSFDNNITKFLDEIKETSDALNTSSQGLTNLAETGIGQSRDLASASEVASGGVNVVAATTEELSASICEINAQISRSSEISAAAVEKSAAASQAIMELQASASKIGDVVGLIRDIAEQTNLLALNATIEAARAGDAGRGFAVVAAEVKGLANQTASSTTEISAQVQNVLDAVQNTVRLIGDIGATINQVNEATVSISAAMEEQATAMNEILRSMQSSGESVRRTQSITDQVSATAHSTEDVALELGKTSADLMAKTESLRGELEMFLSLLKSR